MHIFKKSTKELLEIRQGLSDAMECPDLIEDQVEDLQSQIDTIDEELYKRDPGDDRIAQGLGSPTQSEYEQTRWQ